MRKSRNVNWAELGSVSQILDYSGFLTKSLTKLFVVDPRLHWVYEIMRLQRRRG